MKMIPVRSGNLRTIGYDEHSKTVRVEFQTGKICEYHKVEPHIGEGVYSFPDVELYFLNVIQKLFEARLVNTP